MPPGNRRGGGQVWKADGDTPLWQIVCLQDTQRKGSAAIVVRRFFIAVMRMLPDGIAAVWMRTDALYCHFVGHYHCE